MMVLSSRWSPQNDLIHIHVTDFRLGQVAMETMSMMDGMLGNNISMTEMMKYYMYYGNEYMTNVNRLFDKYSKGDEIENHATIRLLFSCDLL